jgi:hypothetical protein
MTVVTLALCFAATAMCFADSPQMGTWKLNEGRSRLVPGMIKNTKVIYAAEGDKIKVTVEGVDKDGKPVHTVWVGKFDGKPYPVEGNPAYNEVSYKMVNDRINDIIGKKDGKTVWSGTVTVAKDGKSRIVGVSGKDADGKEFSGRAVYDKE